jgi:hypothetical protein
LQSWPFSVAYQLLESIARKGYVLLAHSTTCVVRKASHLLDAIAEPNQRLELHYIRMDITARGSLIPFNAALRVRFTGGLHRRDRC